MNSQDNIRDELVKVRNYIEENLRVNSLSGMPYIDLHNNKSSVSTKQNNVVFGRRGAGKSTLLNEAKKAKVNYLEINMEEYKNISFPNIVIKVLELIFSRILKDLEQSHTLRNVFKKPKMRKNVKVILSELDSLFSKDDLYNGSVETREKKGRSDGIKVGAASVPISAELDSGSTEQTESITKRKYQFEKYEKIMKNLVKYKQSLREVCNLLYIKKPLFILIDDFYFIPIESQPYLADVLHVLTKGLPIFNKIATIKHRTTLYIKDDNSYQGIELGHDAIEIDLDYSLDDMVVLQSFFHALIREVLSITKANVSEQNLFGGDGFRQLCIASGGVTRDFLSLFARCLNDMIVDPSTKIGKEMANAQALSYMSSKLSHLQQDIRKDSEILEDYLYYIKRKIYTEKRTNCFLVAKDELNRCAEERNALRNLLDGRFIHLIDKSTSSAPSDGKQYEAYIIDVGLYDTVRLRNFKQVEPGNKDDRSRKDEMRSSPKLSLNDMKGSKTQVTN